MLRKEKMFKLNFKKVFAFLFAFVLCFGCIDIYADDGGWQDEGDCVSGAILLGGDTKGAKGVGAVLAYEGGH